MKALEFAQCRELARGLTDRCADAAYLVLVEGEKLRDAAAVTGVAPVIIRYAIRRIKRSCDRIRFISEQAVRPS